MCNIHIVFIQCRPHNFLFSCPVLRKSLRVRKIQIFPKYNINRGHDGSDQCHLVAKEHHVLCLIGSRRTRDKLVGFWTDHSQPTDETATPKGSRGLTILSTL